MAKPIQILNDFHLLPGEFFTVTINVRKEDGQDVDVASLTYRMEIFRYGDRTNVLKTINGTKVDSNKVNFKITSSDTRNFKGKLEYVITLAYSNGDENKGMGYITMI